MEPNAGVPPTAALARVRWGIPDAAVAWLIGLVASLVATAPLVDTHVKEGQRSASGDPALALLITLALIAAYVAVVAAMRPPGRLLTFVLGAAVAAGSVAAAVGLGRTVHATRTTVTELLVALVAQSVGVIGWLAVVASRKGIGGLSGDFGLTVRLRDVRWLFLGCGVMLVAGWMVLPINDLAGVHHSRQEVVRVFEHAHGAEVPLFVLAVAVVAPVAEELLFRGVLLRSLLRRTSPEAAVFASALVFALIHVAGDAGTAYYVPAFLLLGLVSGWRALATGRLSQSIWLHAGFNLLGSLLILL